MFHGIFPHNSSKAETTQMYFNGQMVKQTMVHPYHGILFSNKRNKLLVYTITWIDLQVITLSEKSQSLKVTYYIIPFIKHSQNELQKWRINLWLPEVKDSGSQEGRRGYKKATQGILVMLELFYILTIVVDTQTYTCNKLHKGTHTNEV